MVADGRVWVIESERRRWCARSFSSCFRSSLFCSSSCVALVAASNGWEELGVRSFPTVSQSSRDAARAEARLFAFFSVFRSSSMLRSKVATSGVSGKTERMRCISLRRLSRSFAMVRRSSASIWRLEYSWFSSLKVSTSFWWSSWRWEKAGSLWTTVDPMERRLFSSRSWLLVAFAWDSCRLRVE